MRRHQYIAGNTFCCMLSGSGGDWRTIFRVEGGGAAGCVFCEIVGGKRGAHVVFRDSLSMAFLDSRPLFLGHTLLVPLTHYETLTDLPHELVGPLFVNAKIIARAVELAMGAEGTFVAINNRVSQSIPHLHIHVVPRRRGDGLRGFFWPRTRYRDEEQAEQVAEAIRSRIRGSL